MIVHQACFLWSLTFMTLAWSQDWETQNFGIRTFHQKDDLSDRVAIDENAPKIEKTKKRHRFIPKKSSESRRNNIRQLPSREEDPSSALKEVRGRRRGHIRKPQSSPSRGLDIGSEQKSLSLIPTKPNFADFKQSFMEKSLLRHSQETNENKPPLHLEKDVDDNSLVVSPRVADEGHTDNNNVKDQKMKHKFRIRQHAKVKDDEDSSSDELSSESSPSLERKRVRTRARPRHKDITSSSAKPKADVNIKLNEIDDKKATVRTRLRRPIRFKNVNVPKDQSSKPRHLPSRPSPVMMSIKRMRIRGKERSSESLASTESTAPLFSPSDDSVILKPRFSNRRREPSTSTFGRNLVSKTTPSTTQKTFPSLETKRKQYNTETNQFRATESPVTSSSTPSSSTSSIITTTPELITVSPQAHIIRYTKDSSEITSALPINKNINNINPLSPAPPNAEKLVSTFPMPDNVFSLATHTLMKHSDIKMSSKSSSSETTPVLSSTESFLPTFVPTKKRSRGRFILAATSNG